MIYLLDTNVLLAWAQHHRPEHPPTVAAVDILLDAGDEPVLTPQNLVEFWSVASRPPSANGLGLALPDVDLATSRLEATFRLIPDHPSIHDEWRRLVVAVVVQGRQVHDARIVAVMKAHGITHLLTLNTSDFARYPGITVVHPRYVAAPP
jgi:predicted nucleic acid-binding protein